MTSGAKSDGRSGKQDPRGRGRSEHSSNAIAGMFRSQEVASEVILMRALHDRNDGTRLLVIETTQRAIRCRIFAPALLEQPRPL
jgi:hypothetical protein